MEVKHPALREVVDSNLAFLRETRNGSANIEQAKVAASASQRIISGVSTDLKVRLSTPRLQEIEAAAAAA